MNQLKNRQTKINQPSSSVLVDATDPTALESVVLNNSTFGTIVKHTAGTFGILYLDDSVPALIRYHVEQTNLEANYDTAKK